MFEENKREEKFDFLSHVKPALLILITLLIIVYLLTVIGESDQFFEDTAQKTALLMTNEELQNAESIVEGHFNNLYEIAEKVKYAKTKDEILEIFNDGYVGSNKFGTLRYYSQGKAYTADSGNEVTEEISANEEIAELILSNTEGCTNVYDDDSQKKPCIALFVPVRGSDVIDGILSVVPATKYDDKSEYLIDMSDVITDGAVNSALVTADGTIYSFAAIDSFTTEPGNDYYKFLDTLTNDTEAKRTLDKNLTSTEKTAFSVKTHSADYVLTVSPIPRLQNKMFIVTMRESSGLVSAELTYVRHVINLLIVFIIASLAIFIYVIIFRKRAEKAVTEAVTTDLSLECLNMEGFQQESRQLINVGNKCAVMVISIHNFHFHVNDMGEEVTHSILKYIIKTFEAFRDRGECYGYNGDGQFLYLKRFTSDKALTEWVKLLTSRINRNSDMQANGIKLKLDIGAYKAFEGRKRTISEMIECAIAASLESPNNISRDPLVIYSEEVNQKRAKRSRIETQMESALENGEFRVFFQPKYNVANDSIDSAEALVRWFDPTKGDYMYPGEFISQFESNGFITKLDHFVYIKVLEYLSEAAEKGEKIVPISVNVSRVTATSSDFISFYVGNKKKYRVVDGFITIELTESFAEEDYSQLAELTEALHKNGIMTSIDDFGTGYSSFNIIRHIPADELKMDRAFIQKSMSNSLSRDDKILSTVIDLAKSLGMKVVQEGIETKADFDRVVAMGCDVIQGYYYAKAIPLEEYKIFIRTDTSIKYKSLVK